MGGNDNQKSWIKDQNIGNRKKRQNRGGGFMVLGCLVYNGNYRLIRDTLDSDQFIEIINNNVEPWLKEIFPDNNYYLLQDNSQI